MNTPKCEIAFTRRDCKTDPSMFILELTCSVHGLVASVNSDYTTLAQSGIYLRKRWGSHLWRDTPTPDTASERNTNELHSLPVHLL